MPQNRTDAPMADIDKLAAELRAGLANNGNPFPDDAWCSVARAGQLRAIFDDRDRLQSENLTLVNALSEQSRLRGEAEGRLAMSEMAGVVKGWQEKAKRLAKRVQELEAALEPFAKHIDEMKFDLDNNGNPLPDEQAVGWVYVTIGDFRRARALKLEKADG